jgi:hypothetical protein
MAIPTIRPKAVMNLRELQVMGNFIMFMRGVALNMGNHPAIFPSPTPPLPDFTAHIDELEEAQTKTKTRQIGSVSIRNIKYHVVLDDAYSLMSYVQSLADKADNEIDAMAIIEASGFKVRSRSARVKSELEARNTKISGIVELLAKSPGKGCTNTWQMSDDKENWSFLPGTTKAITFVKGLTPASIKYFRHRAVTTKGETNWSQIVSIVVT